MITRHAGLLIGDFQAGTVVNEDGVCYIQMGPIDGDEYVSVDEIEARALCEWLAKSLGFSLTQEVKP